MARRYGDEEKGRHLGKERGDEEVTLRIRKYGEKSVWEEMSSTWYMINLRCHGYPHSHIS